MDTLYERLGGANGISRLVDDVVEAHMNNPAVSARFLPYRERPEVMAQVKRHTCEFFGAGSGGPEQYTGRDMPAAHQGMNISEGEYLAVVDDIMGVLERHDHDQQTRAEVLFVLYSLKGGIVHV